MTVTITIATDNAAFEGEDLGPEVARILRDLADTIEERLTEDPSVGWAGGKLRDSNGNTVGRCDILD